MEITASYIAEHFDHVYVHRDSQNSTVAQRVLRHFSSKKISFVTSPPLADRHGTLSAEEFSESKRKLYLTEFKGSFFKRCPGAKPGLTCCNYFVLNLGLQCNMNCSYCYLQSFINTPVTTVYTNIDKAFSELEALSQHSAQFSFRIGTGEVIDSLSLDPLTLYSVDLIRFIKKYAQWVVEFKTKSAYVEQFLEEPHSKNVIVSWSINPQNIISAEEHGTASLQERLEAAQLCRDKGFRIAFHIDPMIFHEGWKENYSQLVDEITSLFSPDDMPYISVGGLRFQPEQRAIMRERFGMQSLVTSAEMFPGPDGKLRYDQELRREMFDFVVQRFKSYDSRWNLFLCMETPETWIKSQMKMPKQDSGLSSLFQRPPL